MHLSSVFVALAASVSTASAVYQGFNYGATTKSGTVKMQSDFEAEFAAAKKLAGTNGAFSSARLYTMIQGGSESDPISAIAAAISQDTHILLGMWASAGQTVMNNEIKALQTAITKYGTEFTSRVIGLSVGSEDLYRITPTSFANDPNSVGTGPDVIVSYIKQVRQAIAGTALKSVPIGHVDTWTAWVNGSNAAVSQACDWVGMNTFPYFQTTDSNSISDGPKLFFDAVSATAGATGKPVWITETGWPVVGKKSNLAEANAVNAKSYYNSVGCKIFGTVNTFWYSLVDDNVDPLQPEFGVLGTYLTPSSQLLYDLSCPVASLSTSAASTSTASATLSPTATAKSSVVVVPSGKASSSSVGLQSSTSVSTSVSTSAATSAAASSSKSQTSLSVTTSNVIVTSTALSTAASGLTTVVATNSPTPTAVNTASAVSQSASRTSTSTAGAAVATAISYGGAVAGVLAIMAAL